MSSLLDPEKARRFACLAQLRQFSSPALLERLFSLHVRCFGSVNEPDEVDPQSVDDFRKAAKTLCCVDLGKQIKIKDCDCVRKAGTVTARQQTLSAEDCNCELACKLKHA